VMAMAPRPPKRNRAIGSSKEAIKEAMNAIWVAPNRVAKTGLLTGR
jgi:hypothetical protein